MPNEPHAGRRDRSTTNAAPDPARKTTGDVPTVPPQAARPREHTSAEQPPAERAPAPQPRRSMADRRTAARRVVDAVRTRLSDLVWLMAVLAAIVLSIGALLIALGANADNVLVNAFLDAGHAIDGPFWKVFDFYKEDAGVGATRGQADEVKNHLVNWGLAAVAYLAIGRVAHRVIRP